MSQFREYMNDWAAVKADAKPAIIVERRKSAAAYMKIASDAAQTGVWHRHIKLADSELVKHPAIVAGRPSAVKRIIELLETRDQYDRAGFQIAMGEALGYDRQDCIEYTQSRLSRTCGCECCGGPTRESKLDNDARKARTLNFYG